MADKLYHSLFVHDLEVDLPNFLTEILIRNYLNKFNKVHPRCAFWKKDVCQQFPELQELQKKYVVELIGIQQLLKVFNSEIIIKYFQDAKPWAIKYAKKPVQQSIIYDLYQLQIKHNPKDDTYRNHEVTPKKEFKGIATNNKKTKAGLLD